MSQECLSVKGWDNPNKTVIYTQKFTKILSVKQNLDLSGQNQLDLVIFSRTPFLWECSYIFKLAYSPFIRGGGSQFCAEILAWSVPAGKWISSWEININGKNKLGCLSHLKMFFSPWYFWFPCSHWVWHLSFLSADMLLCLLNTTRNAAVNLQNLKTVKLFLAWAFSFPRTYQQRCRMEENMWKMC